MPSPKPTTRKPESTGWHSIHNNSFQRNDAVEIFSHRWALDRLAAEKDKGWDDDRVGR